MTLQEAFDKVAMHLLKQGRPAKKSDGDCVYRAADGAMCAVGCLIPDGMYDQRMEGRTVSSIMYDDEFGLASYFKTKESRALVPLLSALQRVHDSYRPEAWRNELANIAKRYDLDTSVLDKF